MPHLFFADCKLGRRPLSLPPIAPQLFFAFVLTCMQKQSKAQRATRTAAATAARRAARAPTARSLPCASAPSGGLASANRATSVGPAGSSSALVVDVAAAAPPPPPPTAPPTPQRPAPGLRRLIPCAYCVDALLASSSAALCVDNVASGRRSKRCRRCASGHSCRPL